MSDDSSNPYTHLANKIELHLKLDETPGYYLAQVEQEAIVKALRVCAEFSAWQCAARKQSLPEPADCDWPVCGCDPYATKVIQSLEEAGALSVTSQARGSAT